MAKKKTAKREVVPAPAVLLKKAKSKKAPPKGGLTNGELRELMKTNKPPQSWYDEVLLDEESEKEGNTMGKKRADKKEIAVKPAVLQKKPTPKKARPEVKPAPQLTAARLRALAAKHKPPQSWFEEDLDEI